LNAGLIPPGWAYEEGMIPAVGWGRAGKTPGYSLPPKTWPPTWKRRQSRRKPLGSLRRPRRDPR
jgi:hypothetical protein